MCKCNPSVRTPFCGKPGCEWPKPEGEKKESGKVELVEIEKLESAIWRLYTRQEWGNADLENCYRWLNELLEIKKDKMKLKEAVMGNKKGGK